MKSYLLIHSIIVVGIWFELLTVAEIFEPLRAYFVFGSAVILGFLLDGDHHYISMEILRMLIVLAPVLYLESNAMAHLHYMFLFAVWSVHLAVVIIS